MNTIAKVGIGVAIIAAAVALVPALKGPFNRVRNTANEQLAQEFVVDNYKAEYVRLYDHKVELTKSIQKFTVEKNVAIKKHEIALKKVDEAKNILVSTGTENMTAFARAKDAYESAKIEASNLATMISTYEAAVKKLENGLYLVETNMGKARANITTLESKKILVDSIKSVNKTVENLKGVGDSDLGISIEKLDDDMLRESIKLEALQDSDVRTMNREQAQEYLNSLQ